VSVLLVVCVDAVMFSWQAAALVHAYIRLPFPF